jgi:4-amino-4-deoxy-L-arabinose transferase-like glycosyltransferase
MRAAIKRLPREMWICALVAVAAGWVWSFTTPYFQVPDEISHVGYAKYFAETGELPRRMGPPPPQAGADAPELYLALTGVPFSPQGVPVYDPGRSDAVHRSVEGDVERVEESAAGSAANNPPLYYLLEAIPYRLAHSANVFDRILAMRLFSSLFAGLTVAFAFLFLRELLPRTRWAWTAGALVLALQPLLGFVSGGVNPDALLWAASAALFFAIARVFRRGLTWQRGLAVALALACALLTKGAALGLVPGTAVALGLAAWRLEGSGAWRALRGLAVGGAALAVPVVLWITFTQNALQGDANPTATTGSVQAVEGVNLNKEVSYVWQFYLPRLPFMNDLFGGYPLWDVYFQGFVGRFGHFFFDFPQWVNWLALAVALFVVALAGRALWLNRGAVRARLPELISYVAIVVGLLVLLGVAGFQFREREGYPFEQTRYLLPLLALYAGLIAVAARGAGRWGRLVGFGLVALAAGHSVFAVLLTISHYYS